MDARPTSWPPNLSSTSTTHSTAGANSSSSSTTSQTSPPPTTTAASPTGRPLEPIQTFQPTSQPSPQSTPSPLDDPATSPEKQSSESTITTSNIINHRDQEDSQSLIRHDTHQSHLNDGSFSSQTDTPNYSEYTDQDQCDSLSNISTSTSPSTHLVQYYDKEDQLYNVILSTMFAPSYSDLDAALIIATKTHIEGLKVAARAQNIPIERLQQTGQLEFHDAEAILDQLLPGGSKNEITVEQFNDILASKVIEVRKKYPNLFAFGEIVNLLCARNDYKNARKLEALWNDLLIPSTDHINLLCAYDMTEFNDKEHSTDFREICKLHQYTGMPNSCPKPVNAAQANLRIAELEQQNRALMEEVSKRKASEAATREHLNILKDRSIEAIKHQRNEYRELLQHLPVGVCGTMDWDHKGSGIFVNDRFCEISGLTKETIMAGNWLKAVHFADRDMVKSSVGEVKEGKRNLVQREYRFVHVGGDERWVTGSALRSHYGYIETIVDTTEFKRLENAQKEALKSREEKQRARAEEAERQRILREEFIDSLCHELRNPLGGIYGNLDLLNASLAERRQVLEKLLMNKTINEEDRAELQDQCERDLESIEAIMACAVHQKNVSDEVLTLSRLELGKVQLKRVRFDPKFTIKSVVKMLDAQARLKKVVLKTALPEEELHLIGDGARLSQVIFNLMANALKFTDNGTISVELSRISRDIDSSFFRISVQDTGVGLTEDEKAVLFHRFAQAPSTNYSEFGGTGLGLYISKGIVELMGGVIYVESTKWQGSKFSFTFRAEEIVTPPPATSHFNSPQSLDNASGMLQETQSVEEENDAISGLNSNLSMSLARKRLNRTESFPASSIRHAQERPVFTGSNSTPTSPQQPGFTSPTITSFSTSSFATGSRSQSFSTASISPRMELESNPSFSSQSSASSTTSSNAIVSRPALRHTPKDPSSRVKTVLVVDDNPVNLRIIIRILDSSGFTTVSAQNGQEALCILSNRSTLNSSTAVAAGTGSLHESPIDLIIMDMAMPVMSGLDAAKEIRRRESVSGPSVAHVPKRYSLSTSPSNTSNLRSSTSDPSKLQLEPVSQQDLNRFSFPSSPTIPSSVSMGMLGYAAIAKKKSRRIPIIGLSGHLKDSYAERAIECGMDEYITKPFRKNDLLAAIERVCGIQDDDELIEE